MTRHADTQREITVHTANCAGGWSAVSDRRETLILNLRNAGRPESAEEIAHCLLSLLGHRDVADLAFPRHRHTPLVGEEEEGGECLLGTQVERDFPDRV